MKPGLIQAVFPTLQALSGLLPAAGALTGDDDEDAPKQSAALAGEQGAAKAAPAISGDSGATSVDKDRAGLGAIVKAVDPGGGRAGAVYRILLIPAYLVRMGPGVIIHARVRSGKARARDLSPLAPRRMRMARQGAHGLWRGMEFFVAGSETK